MSNYAHVDSIYYSGKERLRFETYGDISELATQFENDGQLQDILVRKFDPSTHPDVDSEYKWELMDGGRRFLAAALLFKTDRKIADVKTGHIGIKIRKIHNYDDLAYQLKLEYMANDAREDFSWKERANYIRRIHTILNDQYEESGWTMEDTASYIGMSRVSVLRYLQLTEDIDIFTSDSVQDADSFRTAHKQMTMLRDTARRKSIVEHRDKEEAEAGILSSDFLHLAKKLCFHGDCRHWIKDIPDEYFDWFHWDPPYGAEQDGGAFGSFEPIDDSPKYAQPLMKDIFPEIFRTLREGGWLALWFHLEHHDWVRRKLKKAGFWVNQHPCIWHKKDRMSDGHEVTKYLVNSYETFLIAGKPPARQKRETIAEIQDKLVIPKSQRQNVFPFEMVPRSDRRHQMHKPEALLSEVLSVISVPGELGGDASAGGGSILHAAINIGRRIEVAELSETYYLTCVEVAAKALHDRGVKLEGEDRVEEEIKIEDIEL